MIKLFAVDLDGTLLRRQGGVAPEDVAALRRIRGRGVAVTIVTGRLYSGTREAAAAIGATGAVACVDGSHIVDASTHRDLHHAPLSAEAAEHVRRALADSALVCFVFAHDEIVHDEHGERFLPYMSTWSTRIQRHHERATTHPHWAHPRGVSEVVAIGPEQATRAAADTIARTTGDAAQTALFPIQWLPPEAHWGLIVRASGHNKGTAVHWLAERMGCGPEHVAVVGDWLNDLSMFAVAGRSFAMGQAPDEVKHAATDVLDATSTTGGGVAEAVRRAGLLE